MFLITLSSTTPIPVSSTACLARGILAWFAAIAAALKILSTCSCVYVENFFCASLTCASFASSASTESTILLSFTSVTTAFSSVALALFLLFLAITESP